MQSSIKAVKSGQFRIIAGQFRSRKLQFPAVDGLRPTPDRVKETLFNWLSSELYQANCLDLYAGSGNLGLEALSRGAKNCVFVEKNKAAADAIKQHLQTLKTQGLVLQAQLPEALSGLQGRFDVVFLDPPYVLESHKSCLDYLKKQQLLNDNALIYCENASQNALPDLGVEFELHRHKVAGAVQYALFRYKSVLSQ